jgi:transposase
MGWYDQTVRRVRDLSCGDTRVFLEFSVRRVACRACGKVKRERLAFLADNPLYTKRFAYFVGRRCRQATIKDVAKELNLDWHTIKELDKQYMAAQLVRAGTPGPKVIGLDEVSVRKGHTYRIVVSDLVRRRPIWFGGTDRSEASMGQVLCLARAQEEPSYWPGGHGHVEAVSQRDRGRRATGGDSVRQVPRHAPLG